MLETVGSRPGEENDFYQVTRSTQLQALGFMQPLTKMRIRDRIITFLGCKVVADA
jgi:hypothetical protein